MNGINRNKASIFLNEDTIDMSVIDMIPYIRNSPSNKIVDTSENPLSTQVYLLKVLLQSIKGKKQSRCQFIPFHHACLILW